MPEDDELRERLGRLRPTVDATAGLDNVVHEATRRGRRDRVLAGVAVVAVLVLVTGVAFGAARSGSDPAAEVVAVGPGPGSGPSSTTTASPGPGSTTPPGTDAPGTVLEAPGSTETTASLPPPTASTMAPTSVVTTAVPPAPPAPPSTVAGAPDVVMTLRPTVATVSLGDRLLVDVTVTNRGSAPAYFDSNFCGYGLGLLAVSDREPAAPRTGREWDGDPNGYGNMLAVNAFPDGTAMVEEPLIESAPASTCAAYLGMGVLAAGESTTDRVAWEVHLGPEALPTAGTLFVAGSFTFGTTRGTYDTQMIRASTTIRLTDDPRRTTTGAAAYTAAASEPVVRDYVRDVAPRAASFFFGRGEWVLVVSGSPYVEAHDVVVVRVDPDTGVVRSAQRLPWSAQPRI